MHPGFGQDMTSLIFYISIALHNQYSINLIHDVDPSQLSGTSHRSSEALPLLDARRDTVTHRATINKCNRFVVF